MKKKFLSFLMLGALVVTSVAITSCKDYDDDINAVKGDVSTLSDQIKKLDQDLSASTKIANDALATAKTAQATGDAAKTLAESANAAAAKAQAKADENAIELLKQLEKINGKVDTTVYNEKIREIEAKIVAINEKLDVLGDPQELLKTINGHTAAINDLNGQVATLEEFKKQIDALNLGATIGDLTSKIDNAIDSLEKVKKLVAQHAEDIAQLKNDMALANQAITNLDKALNKKISDLAAKVDENSSNIAINKASINTLNVYVSRTITSLVFKPAEYVLSFGAIPVYTIDGLHEITVTPNNGLTETGENYTVASAAMAITPQAIAEYWLNPSTADVDKYTFKFVDLETTNRTRGHNDNTSVDPQVDSVNAVGGVLSVFFKFNSANVNDAVTDNATGKAWVSTLALQATHKNLMDEQATVTSNYAVLSPTYMRNLDLGNNEYKANTPYERTVIDYLLVKHSSTAINSFVADHDSVSFKLGYNDENGLDLDEKIDVLYQESASSSGPLSALKSMSVADARKRGLDVTYTLVPYTLDASVANPVDETAATKIQIENGVAKVTPASKESKDAVGHMALVRVEIKNAGKSVVIGYVSILVVPSGLYQVEEEYSQGLYLNCNSIYGKTVTQVQLLQDMKEETQLSDGILNDYYLEQGGRYKKPNDPDPSPFGSVMLTNTELRWEFTLQEIREKFYDENGKFKAPEEDLVTYVKMVSPDPLLYPDVWVKLTIKKENIFHAMGTVDLTSGNVGAGIKQVWYAAGSTIAGSGFAEIHANVEQPGNVGVTDDKKFESNLYAAFVGNKPVATIANKAQFPSFTDELDIYFDVAKYNKELATKKWEGTSKKEYILKASPDTVFASLSENGPWTPVVVLRDSAQIVNGTPVPGRWVTFQNNDIAKDLLNRYAHKEKDEDVTKAFYTYMILRDTRNCFPLDLSGTTTFDVRYLRPIDVVSSEAKPFEDAELAGGSELYIADLFKFNDWRDFSFGKGEHEDWIDFYGITALTPTLDGTMTNINGKWQKLSDVTNLISLTEEIPAINVANLTGSPRWIAFATAMGKIRYQNNGFTTGDFDLKIPFTVIHNWGKIENVEITVHVKKTVNNAKGY